MGKKRGFRGGGRGGRGGQRGGERVEYPPVVKQNELFEKYYDNLGIFMAGEGEEFWGTLRRDLPSSFRFTGSKGHALSVKKRLTDHYIPEITSINYNDAPVEPPAAVSWYPDELAYSMTTPKNVVRRFPPFASFQKFLVSETSVGNISRQEIVSMIPPLLMDIRPGMTVLDLCAAPGSKTAQLIEMVHRGEEARVRKSLRSAFCQEGRELSPDGFEIEMEIEDIEAVGDWSDNGRSTGLVIANDADYKRAYMLIHQTKRLNSPNLIVTNHDATLFPSIRLPSLPTLPDERPKTRYLKFDRILADVPCSGDGTCRKNPNVWKDWTPQNALGLHNTQVRILVRGLQMLKVGGRIVYSTCSMNPVENEAVIASAVDRCGGPSKVHIVDCTNELLGLKRSLGLTSWAVMDKKGRMWESWKDVQDEIAREGIEFMGRIAEDMFPPASVTNIDGFEPERIPLERCMRVYGHFQDTGGFFITVLEKKTEIKARPESEQKKSAPAITTAEIAATQQTNVTYLMREVDALGGISSLKPLPEVDSPVARQSQEIHLLDHASPAKRSQDDRYSAVNSSKRPKLGEELESVTLERERIMEELEPVRSGTAQPSKAKRNGQPTEEPFKFISHGHEELKVIYDFYKLSDKFPRDRFMVRNASGLPAKTIYYTSALARDVLTQNEGKGVRFVHCGVKMFMKQDVQREGTCKWRVQTDGLPLLEPWIGEDRIVRLYKRQTLRKLLKEMFPKVNGGGWEHLGEIGERVRDIEMGCCVLRVETSDAEDGFRANGIAAMEKFILSELNVAQGRAEVIHPPPLARGARLLTDIRAMLLRLYDDDSPIEDSSKDRHLQYIVADSPTGIHTLISTDREEATQQVPEGQPTSQPINKDVKLTGGDIVAK
ncbi:hypothetical protein FGG08_004064 [Glutinoglossum americanum]|uniref:SAM-dependent MTase RsmB/NOP-type domain-containing protein n=1 Tax=Glutinoglossum americanum TaxID=1670608 RepID=A0A9P8I8B3_9PEZI|nr:hypothetical protein FGG08_004064 [Glutinoglossum americanum]